MNKKLIISVVVIFLSCIALLFLHKKRKKEIIMGSPWLLYSDEKLLETFEDEALNGKNRVIQSNKILYERFYLGKGNLTKAMPFLEVAADLGDEEAKEILKSPEQYYRDLKKRCGESIPENFKLK
jgi:hypothetical protein